jgi:hypothetical protein
MITTIRRPGNTAKAHPFTICILSNPCTTVNTTQFLDPINSNQAGFDQAARWVEDCLFANFPGQGETLLATANISPKIRLVSVFISYSSTSSANALIDESNNYLDPDRPKITAYLHAINVNADIVFIVSSSRQSALVQPSAKPSVDDPARGSSPKSFTLDPGSGAQIFYHYEFCREPGVVAIHADEPAQNPTSMTPLHEFSHAMGSINQGIIVDLYRDNPPPLSAVNKRRRARQADPIPNLFYRLNGTSSHTSSMSRGWTQYPPNWLGFHCQLNQPAYPALMDDYTAAAAGASHLCEHDTITRNFLLDRLAVKIGR